MQRRAAKGTVAFSVVTLDPARRSWLKNACEVLSRRVGVIVYPQVAPSYSDLARNVRQGTVEMVWAPPLVAAELVEDASARVLVLSQRDNAATYRSVLFARRDSGIRGVQDLRDKHVAWVDARSASGYVVPCIWLRDNGLSPENLFGRQSFLGTHDAVARAVLRRETDAGATFARLSGGAGAAVESGWQELAQANAAEVDVIVNAGSVPSDCICTSARLDPELRSQLERGFLDLDVESKNVLRKALGAHAYVAPGRAHALALSRLCEEARRLTRRSIYP
ncbi:MAG: phosphate/phosphite/phosphonate ABC transporter substrate-binding protein [Myxococcales bacterium]|nr:phosphate/phosphite/phosphonate ABC transporter substrate-binding protein [Myxococcales bacterium]MCB9581401.1 phosphate/phosphite/phosphonate ABC transporter substrate-binding protein [Polyangiaceae bacterium]